MYSKTAGYVDVQLLRPNIGLISGSNGTTYLKSKVPLDASPNRITDRLVLWAKHKPNEIFIGQRDQDGNWCRVTYSELYDKVKSVSQYLLEQEVSSERPVAILSGNSIEHAIISLAAMHVGIPLAPISPAYSLSSTDYNKLHHCIELLTPGLIFVQSGRLFEDALAHIDTAIKTISVDDPLEGHDLFANALNTEVTLSVDEAYNRVKRDTVAKILFTSGSTGLPKGVINTHGNITTNGQQTLQTFPFMNEVGFHILDWLPWHHTFGGNNNFGMALYTGGSIHIDDGAPTPSGISKTMANLKEIAPTIFYNVPKGYEVLLPYLQKDPQLCEQLFSRLKKFFYAGANMSQHIWDAYEDLAIRTLGKRVFMGTALGMTEASPSAIFSSRTGMAPGQIGVPVPGLSVKLVPAGDKIEARFKGANITPGYWRNPEATAEAFDEEGYYKTGDAVQLLNAADPNMGLVFDGRIAEDFKLSTGAWVSVGTLRKKIVKASSGLIRDAVIAGHDKSYLTAILIPDEGACRALIHSKEDDLAVIVRHEKLVQAIQDFLDQLGQKSTGSSTCVRRALIADFMLSIDKGEVTDKGSINQRGFLKNRKQLVDRLYKENPDADIYCYTG